MEPRPCLAPPCATGLGATAVTSVRVPRRCRCQPWGTPALAPRCQGQVTTGCGTGALAKPILPSGSQPSSRLPLKSRTGRAGRWWQGERGARQPKSEPKLGARFAGAHLAPGDLCHAAEQLCKPMWWCKLTCWCKSVHQCNPTAVPVRDAAPALLLLCAPPRPRNLPGTPTTWSSPLGRPCKRWQPGFHSLGHHQVMCFRPSIPPRHGPHQSPRLCPAPELGPSPLPRETGVPETSPAGTAPAAGAVTKVASKDFKSPSGPEISIAALGGETQ